MFGQPQGPPQQQHAPPQFGQQQAGQSALAELQNVLKALHAYIQAEPDPNDKQVAGQCLVTLIRLAQKDQTDTQGGQPQQGPPSLAMAAAGHA